MCGVKVRRNAFGFLHLFHFIDLLGTTVDRIVVVHLFAEFY